MADKKYVPSGVTETSGRFGTQPRKAAGAIGGTWGQPPVGIRRADRITVGSHEDRRQERFIMGRDDTLWHIWQVAPHAGWSHGERLGQPRDLIDGSEPPQARDRSEPCVQKNADGHLQVFAPGHKARCHRSQGRWREGPNRVVWRHQGSTREATATA